ncbi:MAG TPA: CopD family protein [Polyangiales bacterium]|nr:CopD family protein [Polyangiales bacterium]
MNTLYLISVWLHILAATVWIGGMTFLVLVVVPWLREGGRAQGAVFLRETGARFRNVGWVCFAIVLVTGSFNLWVRGVRPASFVQSAWLGSPFGTLVLWKLGVFAAVLLLSSVHDFVLGPRATVAIARDPQSIEAQALRRRASYAGRANVLLALVLVAIGVMLVRGLPG